MKDILRSQHHPVWNSFRVLTFAVGFILLIGLACNTPTSESANKTQIALNVQATQLAQSKTQTAEAGMAQAGNTDSGSGEPDHQATQNAQATQVAQTATQIAIDVQSTVNAQQLTQAAAATNTPTNTATPTQTTEAAAQPADNQSAPQPQATFNEADFETWMKSASILLFEDMTGDFSVTRYIQQALEAMGIKQYVDVRDALGNYKNQLLSGGPGGKGWDLIISGKELRTAVQGEFYVYLNDALNAGSSVIIEEWDIDAIASGKISTILSRCGVGFHRDWQEINLDRHLLYPVDGTHAIHHFPNEGISLTNPTGYWLGGDLGDWLRINPGSGAIALWGARVNVRDSYLTAVACLDGQLIIQTYSSHSYGQDRIVRMWQNYIYNTLKARYLSLGAQ